METSLPDLPFPCQGVFSDPSGPRSSANANPRTYPRTDLRVFQRWQSFDGDIDNAIRSAMRKKGLPQNMTYAVGPCFSEALQVFSEEDIRSHASGELHRTVKDVLKLLGIEGLFAAPGGGNRALVGEPDFSWLSGEGTWHPKLVVEYKTDWVAALQNLRNSFAKPGALRSRNEQQSVEAIEQLYGYMTFNSLRYGILTNWTRTWAFRRLETNGRETLQYAGPFTTAGLPSLLKVFVGMVLLAEEDWFYMSPTSDIPPPSFGVSSTARNEQKKAIGLAGDYYVVPTGGFYPLLPLDFRLCNFFLSSARHSEAGCIVYTKLHREALDKQPLSVMCKIVDALRNPATSIVLESEANKYATLRHLQGVVIPRFYGYYQVWGILRVLALEPVGESIRGRSITPDLRQKMKIAIRHIHDAGYVHGDISPGNFCERDGKVFVIDFERCRQSTDKYEMKVEEGLVDSLSTDVI